MNQLLLIGVFSAALIAGPAFAQSTTVESGTSSTTSVPGSSSVERTEKRTDSLGGSMESKEESTRDSTGATSRVERKVERPDGSSESVTRERSTETPAPPPSGSTTIINR